jgi:dTDP-4-dehydrorhamnose 3,5-epimerase
MIKLVMFDVRKESPTQGELQEVFIGRDNYCLVRIPPGVYNGFKAYGVEPAIVANCPDLPHEPGEMERLDPSDPGIPYQWDLEHR